MARRTPRICTRATTLGWTARSRRPRSVPRPALDRPSAWPHVEWRSHASNRGPMTEAPKPALKVLLCSPRGFCPGVVRAIDTVERELPRYGAPAYVPHDTADIVAALKARFPQIHGPHKEDICYATTNRQEVVKKVAPMVEAMVVVGSPNSSNTQRLKEVAERAGCPRAALVQRAKEIDWSVFGSIASLGVTAGASAPEDLVEEVIGAFAERYVVNVETVTTADEDMFFPLPRVLRGTEAAE